MNDDELFRRAMAQAGVKKIDQGPERVPRAPPKGRRGEALPQRRHVGRFDVERMGERVEGLVEGGDARQLHLLQRGDFHVELELDLHGHSEEAARRRVEELVDQAYAAGKRCLLVIHGRGHRSPGKAVLKEAMPDWLTGPRCAARVFAFSTAPPDFGGAGATLILLRRKR